MKVILLSIIATNIFSFFCNKVEKKVQIEDLNSEHSIVLNPKKGKAYTTYQIVISGNVDDSVKIDYLGHPIYFNGRVSFEETHDYYGSKDFEVSFIPYKATSGTLTIEASIF